MTAIWVNKRCEDCTKYFKVQMRDLGKRKRCDNCQEYTNKKRNETAKLKRANKDGNTNMGDTISSFFDRLRDRTGNETSGIHLFEEEER